MTSAVELADVKRAAMGSLASTHPAAKTSKLSRVRAKDLAAEVGQRAPSAWGAEANPPASIPNVFGSEKADKSGSTTTRDGNFGVHQNLHFRKCHKRAPHLRYVAPPTSQVAMNGRLDVTTLTCNVAHSGAKLVCFWRNPFEVGVGPCAGGLWCGSAAQVGVVESS